MKLLQFIFKRNKKLINDNSDSEEAKFVLKRMSEGIGIKTSLIEYALLKRKISFTRLNRRTLLAETKRNELKPFVQMNGVSSSRVGKLLCDRKHDTRFLLNKSDINVIESKKFNDKQYDLALKYAREIGFPVVVKPTVLARGRGVTAEIQDEQEFKQAWNNAISAYRKSRKVKEVLVERHFYGDDYRLFVVGNKVISATLRKRANVVGDGKSTIRDLIRRKNENRLKNPYLCDYVIPENPKELDLLTKQGYKLDDTLDKGKELTLRSQSNISAGGDSIDVTDKIHKDYERIAIQAVKSIPGMEYAGVDFIAEDLKKKPNSQNHIVSEVEFSPAPLAQFPYKGKHRDIAGAIVEYYFK